MPKRYAGLVLFMVATVAMIAFAAWPRPASAACGSSASSCKDCHEVQKQDPVNDKGEWHTAHAFGDFCEFCHGGNVKGQNKASAHTGLISPLADVKASCQSCHPNDYMDRAQKYATALGKPLGSGDSAAPTPAPAAAATTGNGGNCGPAAPGGGGGTIDLNKVYADTNVPPPANIGNILLTGMIVLMVLALAGLVWHYEKPLPRLMLFFRRSLAAPIPAFAAAAAGDASGLSAGPAERPELGPILPLLRSSDPATVRALAHLLSDRENGPRVIKALSNLDFRSLAALSEGDQKTLAALLALAKEMKS